MLKKTTINICCMRPRAGQTDVAQAPSAKKAKKGKGITTTYFCAVTESKLVLAKKKGPAKAYSWVFVNDFVADATKLTLKFENKLFLLFAEPLEPLVKAVQQALCHILTNAELAVFTFSGKMKSVRSGYGAFCRLNEMLENKVSKISEAEQELYSNVLLFRRPRLHLVEGASADSQKMLFNIIELSDCIEELIVQSKASGDIFNTIMPLAKDRSGVKYLELRGEVTPAFSSFCDYLTNNRQSAISGLGFHDAKLKRSDIEKIRQVVLARKMQSLSFDGSIEQGDLSFMYGAVFPSMFESSLVSVSMDHMKIDLDALLESLPSVRFLSVRNCGLQVAKAIKSVSEFRNIHRIDLSENLCDVVEGLDFALPETLKDVVIDKVKFSDDHLKALVLFLFKEMPRRSVLSLRRAKASNSGWEGVFKTLSGAEPMKLKGLKWDGNLVTLDFMRYVAKGVLTQLSLSGCMADTDGPVVECLCEWIRNSKTLTEFVCCGHKEKRLNALHAKVIAAVGRSSTLTIVDLTGQGGQRNSISALEQLIETNRGIRRLAIDELHPEDPEQVVTFLRSVKDEKEISCVAFPEVYLKEMVKEQKLKAGDYNEILDMFRVPYPNDYIKPFHLSTLTKDDARPFYLTTRAIELLTLYPTEASYMKGVRRIPKIIPKKKFVSVFMPRFVPGENVDNNLRNLKSESTHGFDLKPEKEEEPVEAPPPIPVKKKPVKRPPAPKRKESNSVLFKLKISSDSVSGSSNDESAQNRKEKSEKRKRLGMNRNKSLSTERMKTAPLRSSEKTTDPERQETATAKDRRRPVARASKFASQEGEPMETISGFEKPKPTAEKRPAGRVPPRQQRRPSLTRKHGINQKKALLEFNSSDGTQEESSKKTKVVKKKKPEVELAPHEKESTNAAPTKKAAAPIKRYVPVRSRKRVEEEQTEPASSNRTPMQRLVKQLLANPIGIKQTKQMAGLSNARR